MRFFRSKKLTPKKAMNMPIEEIMEMDESELSAIEDRNVLAVLFGRIFIHTTGRQIECLKGLRKSLEKVGELKDKEGD